MKLFSKLNNDCNKLYFKLDRHGKNLFNKPNDVKKIQWEHENEKKEKTHPLEKHH